MRCRSGLIDNNGGTEMTSTSLFARGGIRALALAMTAVFLTTACNSSESIAPTTVNIPTVPSLGKGLKGSAAHVVWTIIDRVSGDSIPYTAFTYRSANGTLFTLADNEGEDLDQRPGVYEVVAEKDGPMTICATNWNPTKLVLEPQPGGGNCFTPDVSGKLTTVKPWLTHLKTSAYWWASANGIPTYSGTYSIKGPYGFVTTVVGNGYRDLAKNPYVYVQLPWAGAYTICQTVPPPGTKLPAQPCVTFNETADAATFLPIFVNKSL